LLFKILYFVANG